MEPVGETAGKIFTLFAIVGMINAINHSDGLDGLAGGESVMSLAAISYLAYRAGDVTGLFIAFAAIGGVFGFLRFNSHYHGMVLEGGFDEEGNFVFIPFDNLDKMSEYFRRMIIKFFLDKKLINERFARNLLAWRHSGFSINNEIRIYGWDEKARENLSQYIARPPISLKKVFYEPFHSKVLFKTKYNDYFKENVKKVKSERARLTEQLIALDFDVPDSSGNFVLAQCRNGRAAEIYKELTKRNIYVRYFDYPRLEDKLRITVGTPEQDDKLLAALKEIVA